MKKILVLGLMFGTFATVNTTFATSIPITDPVIDSSEARKDLIEKQKEQMEALRASSTEAREIRKASSSEVRDARKEERDVRKASSSTAREEMKKLQEQREIKAGIERAKHAIERLNRQIADLEKLSTRISKHLALRKSKGADTSAAEAKLLEAQAAITTAKGKVASIGIAIQSALNAQSTATTTPVNVNNILKNLKPQILDAEKSVRDAMKALRDAMKVRTPKLTSTGTVSTSTMATSTTATTTATTTQQ